MQYWKIESGKEHTLHIKDPQGWYSANVRWDGCIEFYRLYNVPLPMTEEHPQLIDNIHICDVADLIARLQSLKEISKIHFSQVDMGYEYWDNCE